jgi:formate hydrogenlyase subunit 4
MSLGLFHRSWIETLLALLLAPLLPGVIARVKALAAGRRGQPLLQLYFDIAKLLRKGAVYSQTTSWVFRAGPIVSLAACATALLLVPYSHSPGCIAFPADFVVMAYVLALGRFFTVLAALDTGSAFEGMGASREVHFAALVEPTLFLGLAALARKTGGLSLSAILPAASPLSPEVLLVGAAFVILMLCETARVPFDDPNTHLELTMVHEVMILDHGGPDLALAQYAAGLKLWLWSALVLAVFTPPALDAWARAPIVVTLVGVLAVAAGIGVIESTMARLRLTRVPHLLTGALALAVLAFILATR